jgi:hypothetical protein
VFAVIGGVFAVAIFRPPSAEFANRQIRAGIYEPRQLATIRISDNRDILNITMDVALLAQLKLWRDECFTALKDSRYTNNPANLVKRSNLHGLNEIQWCESQFQLFSFLLNNHNNNFNQNLVPHEWRTALTVLYESYFGSRELAYTVDSHLITRSEIAMFGTSFAHAIGLNVPELTGFKTIADHRIVACVGDCTQYWHPNANFNVNDFTQGAGDGDGDYFDELDEGINDPSGGPDDATTYWQSGTNPIGNTISCTPLTESMISVGLSDLITPDVRTGHHMRVRVAKSASGGRQIDAYYNLCEDEPVIDQIHASSSQSAISNTWATLTYSLSEAEATDIDQYIDLVLSVNCDTVGGGPGRGCYVSTMELETPDGTAAEQRSSTFIQD